MTLRPKTSCHLYCLIAFYLHCLPEDLLRRIPRSTRHEWIHRNVEASFGYDWYHANQHLFQTLQAVSANNTLLRINRVLLRVIALKKFIHRHIQRVKDHVLGIDSVVLNHFGKISAVLGVRAALRYLDLPRSWYLALRQKARCANSVLSLCRIKHPGQLLKREVQVIHRYCTEVALLHWPLASVYHRIRRDQAGAFSLSTFYKYVSLLNLKRVQVRHRRKNHDTGLRAARPLQILHADATIFRTADHLKSCIYLVQDNCSRAILAYTVSQKHSARHTFDNLNRVYEQYLRSSGLDTCQLITDDGSENLGEARQWVLPAQNPAVEHLIAQRDIVFSNSMIEAVNRQLKYRFLYHQHIPDFEALQKYLAEAVTDYNHRPHHVLGGLTPLEVLQGHQPDRSVPARQMALAREARTIENRKFKCCGYSF